MSKMNLVKVSLVTFFLLAVGFVLPLPARATVLLDPMGDKFDMSHKGYALIMFMTLLFTIVTGLVLLVTKLVFKSKSIFWKRLTILNGIFFIVQFMAYFSLMIVFSLFASPVSIYDNNISAFGYSNTEYILNIAAYVLVHGVFGAILILTSFMSIKNKKKPGAKINFAYGILTWILALGILIAVLMTKTPEPTSCPGLECLI